MGHGHELFSLPLKIGISSREDLFFSFGKHLRLVSLALVSDFFGIIGLGFERCVLNSTSVLNSTTNNKLYTVAEKKQPKELKKRE